MSNPQRDRWLRVNRARPCPICDRADWCLLSSDETVAICARTESPKRCGEAGWLHRLVDAQQPRQRRPVIRIVGTKNATPEHDFATLAEQYRNAVDHERLGELAKSLGLSIGSLQALGIGWSSSNRSWSFPMTNHDGNTLGIRLRKPDGSKLSVRGGKEGLFLPEGEPSGSPLVIVEGASDAAALWDLGFHNVAGRPSCNGGTKLALDLTRARKPAQVVIVADGDEPGQRGASALASQLILHVRDLRIVVPPRNLKDCRAWVCSGATRADVQALIEVARPRRLTITTEYPRTVGT